MSEEANGIVYEVKGKIAVITLNLPSKLNALDAAAYLQLGKYVEQADKEEETVATIIQSTGRFFSAGADFADKKTISRDAAELFSHEHWLAGFVARNTWLTNVFNDHSKILVAAANGPVIGLSAALLLLCDLIYVNDLSKFYLLTPFANLGLVTEGATSITLTRRLGWSKASEALLLAKKIPGEDCEQNGLINKHFTGQSKSTEDFNKAVFELLQDSTESLHEDSIFGIKKLMKLGRDPAVNHANSQEVVRGFNKWIEGVPQMRFAQLANKERKHKM
ncbi:ECI1 [Candida margitis]|uniref:ECI1 n=1 Tax=Candida margitis TaxID=1775924 RepID=UPI002226E14C|nr:ECI1 [Candida margitis]KAI5970665.1 ECI1 [Candida margitis]